MQSNKFMFFFLKKNPETFILNFNVPAALKTRILIKLKYFKSISVLRVTFIWRLCRWRSWSNCGNLYANRTRIATTTWCSPRHGPCPISGGRSNCSRITISISKWPTSTTVASAYCKSTRTNPATNSGQSPADCNGKHDPIFLRPN